ncbi:MAG: hypothetical protein IAE78_09770 [Myxococcus sp.]|nr:hypothetical protein [Myxococcus sp.]
MTQARCSAHDAPAVGACARCGRVVCATCERRGDDGRCCDACQPFSTEAASLSAWWLAAAGLSLGAPLHFLVVLKAAWEGLRARSLGVLLELEERSWLAFTLAQLTSRLVVGAIAVVAVRRVLARRDDAAGWLAAGALAFVLATVVLASLSRWLVPELAGPEWVELSVTALLAGLWLRYFTRTRGSARSRPGSTPPRAPSRSR